MSDSGSGKDDETQSTRSKMKLLFDMGLEMGIDEFEKGRLKLEQSVGLGHKPNVVPPGEPVITSDHRLVEIGWHPVAGLAGKWLEDTSLGKFITGKVERYPDPTQHWAVLVGNYCHELWMDEKLDVIYINEKIVREEWHTFEVGKTGFNDEALRQAGEMVISNMREKQAAYNLINNNCQNFALFLLDTIHIGAHREFTTAGQIRELFIDKLPVNKEDQETSAPEQQNAVPLAQQVMEEQTTKVETQQAPA